jgi:FMN reductase
MKYLDVSCSLSPISRSRLLAEAVRGHLQGAGEEVDSLDLREIDMPLCDGAAVYSQPVTGELGKRVGDADGILMAVPIYNFDVNAAAKNLIELTGRAWTDKVVAFACSAGGGGVTWP